MYRMLLTQRLIKLLCAFNICFFLPVFCHQGFCKLHRFAYCNLLVVLGGQGVVGAFLLLVVLLLLLCMLLSVPTRLGRGKPVQITRLRGPNKIVYRSPEPILGEFGSGFCDTSVRSLKSGVFPVSLCVLFVNILTYLLI